MYTRRNLAVGLVLAISMVGISHGAGGILPGDGLSESTAYLIEDLTDFDVFADQANAATYWSSGVHTKLTCDPNLTGRPPYTTTVIAPDTDNTNWQFDGIPFEGNFNGNGHIIRNLTIDTVGAGNDYLGLFGEIAGAVKNLGIENTNITGGTDSDHLGGLCGLNDGGTITNCYATGSVIGDHSLGGLCGENRHGTITNCYATGAVTGYNSLGGLCGFNYYGTITNCYSGGSVTGGIGSYYLGGLCGYNFLGGLTTNCFWDIETGGPDNGIGTPKTTAEMQTQSTFTDADWDFSVVPVWHMPFQAIGYPMLGWQKDIPGDFTGRYGVYMDDFAVFSNAWLSDNSPSANWNEHCDLNDNGMIDIIDLKTFAENWLCK